MKAIFCLCDNKGTLCPVHNFDDFIRAETSPATIQIIMLNRYIREWKALDSAHNTISRWPIIHFIQDNRILRAKHILTRKFENELNSLQNLKK